MIKHITIIILILFFHPLSAFTQTKFLRSFKIDQLSQHQENQPPSNSISHINIQDSVIWIGTSKGAAKSIDGGRTWTNYTNNPAFADYGIYALAVYKNIVWASTGFNKELEEGSIQTGSGFAYTTSGGNDWLHTPQPLDTCIELPSSNGKRICKKYIPVRYGINDSVNLTAVTTPVANVTFDISLAADAVWIASWSSGLRKTTNNGSSWENILLPLDSQNSLKEQDSLWYFTPGDTLRKDTLFQNFDVVLNNNLKAFSVLAVSKDTVWCGTAGGVNKSTDGGLNWVKYSHQNQSASILGNWVISIKEQRYRDIRRIWITNWKATDPQEQYGVSYTENDGKSWKNLLIGIKAYDFAFKDSIAYIATDEGVYRTTDGGLSFSAFNTFYNSTTHQVCSAQNVYAVGVLKDTILVGTADGLANTIDDSLHQFGMTWSIFQTYTISAYPNPFSQTNDRVIKIRYSSNIPVSQNPQSRTVSIEIFDFGMNRVRTLINNVTRTAVEVPEERWDGKNDNGELVASGVYFYRVKINDDKPFFGKILVLP